MSNQTIMVIAAHPDDEVLGVGGTVRRHVLDGDEVHALIVCEGETMRYQGRDVKLQEQTRKAADILGYASVTSLNLRDQHLDTVSLPDIIGLLDEHLQRVGPQTVYTQFWGDLNRDHRIVAEAVLVACRPLLTVVEEILGFDTASSTEWNIPYQFSPNLLVDISATLDDKLRAMACYATEVRNYPHPRSLESLQDRARHWGSCGMMEAAEAFVIYRRLRRRPGNK